MRNVFFTFNNPRENGWEGVELAMRGWEQVRFMTWQKEEGDRGTPHMQGVIQFKQKSMLSTIMNKMRGKAHLEKMWGTIEQAIHYCHKPCVMGTNNPWRFHEDGRVCDCEHCKGAMGKRLEGPWEFGESVNQGERTDLEKYIDDVREGVALQQLVTDHPKVVMKAPHFRASVIQAESYERKIRMFESGQKAHVTVLYGSAGKGKTRYVYEKHGARSIHKVVMGDGTSKSLWFDGYEMQPVLLLDDFRESAVRFEKLLRLLDRYPEPCQIKNGLVFPCYTHIYITCPHHPQWWYPKVMAAHPEQQPMLLRRIDEIIDIDEVQSNPPVPLMRTDTAVLGAEVEAGASQQFSQVDLSPIAEDWLSGHLYPED